MDGRFSPGEPSETFVVDPRIAPANGADRPHVVWAAPGSLFVDRVDAAWSIRASLSDLASVTGPWGVVLWDPRRSEYVVACDPVGVQPLYLARATDGRFVVGSWLAQVVDRPDVDDALDYEGILFDTSNRISGERVLHRSRFRDVRRIAWGRAERIHPDGSTTSEKYWDPADLPPPDEEMSLHDCADALRDVVDRAIRRLVDPALPTAAHVSGGLDCTSVACRAQDILRESGSSLVAAYSWSPDEREVPRFPGDERLLLDAVAERLGRPIEPIYADESGDWFFDVDSQRYAQSTTARERFVLPRAHAAGARVILSGWGGDELASFNGRGIPTMLVRRGRLWTLWRLSRRSIEVRHGDDASLAASVRLVGGRIVNTFPSWVGDLRRPREAFENRRHGRRADALLQAYSPLGAETRRERSRSFDQAVGHRAVQLELLRGGHIQHRTGWWYQTGRLFDVHYRYPLLDVDVVRTALGLPWWAFLSEGWGRTAFRLAIEPWVPPVVAWNPNKYEPANFWPPERIPVERSTPAPTHTQPDDPRLREVMDLVAALRPPNRRRISDTARVKPRVDAAVR